MAAEPREQTVFLHTSILGVLFWVLSGHFTYDRGELWGEEPMGRGTGIPVPVLVTLLACAGAWGRAGDLPLGFLTGTGLRITPASSGRGQR